MDNPKFIEAKNAGRSTYNIPQQIYNFMIMPDNSLLVPRGLRAYLFDQINEAKIECSVKDARTYFPMMDVDSSEITYKPYQSKAINNLVLQSEGMLISPAGSGKTVMGLSLIPLLGQPTLWLTHTGQLAEQAKDRANKFLPGIGKIGLIGDGKWDIGEVLTIGMVQTLCRNTDKLIKISNNFGMVIVDECLVAETTVLMLDGTIKNIEDVENGSVTTFGKVMNKFERISKTIITLRGGWGKLSGTPTHELPIVSKNVLTVNKNNNRFHLIKEEQVNMTTMDQISRGDMVLVPETYPHTYKYKIGTGMSRLLALIACDGHIEKYLRCIQIGVKKDKEWFRSEMFEAAKLFLDSDIRISECKRGDLILRNYSKTAINFLNKFIPSGKKHELYVPDIMEYASIEDIKNYLQVVFDTEGGLNRNQITITMATPEFLYGVCHLLRKFGIVSRIIPINKLNSSKNSYLRLAMSGYDAFLFYYKIGFSMERKQSALLEIIKKANKFVRRVSYKGVVYRCMDIIAKNIKNKSTSVFDFTTEKHLFVANGVLSSNCHHCPSRTFIDVVGHLNPYYLYGLTATPFRRDKLENLMFQALGTTKTVVTLQSIEKYVVTPKVRYRTIPSKVENDNNIQMLLKKYIVDNNKRSMLIVSDVIAEAITGNFCIVVSDRKEHCENLYELISTGWEKTGIATGSYSKAYVTEQVDRFNKNDITVLVTTFALLGEGFDVPFLNRAFVTMPFRAKAKAVQLVGRVQRAFPGKTDAIVYDYVDSDVGIFKNQFISKSRDCRYNTYKGLGMVVEPY